MHKSAFYTISQFSLCFLCSKDFFYTDFADLFGMHLSFLVKIKEKKEFGFYFTL